MTPDEIALQIMSKWNDNKLPMSLGGAIAAAIRAERERAEKAEAERETLREMWIDSIDQCETWGIAAAEERIRAEAAEAERDRLRDALRERVTTETSNAMRMRAAIVEARRRLAKGRATWNGPCHECDGVLEQALSASNDSTATGEPING